MPPALQFLVLTFAGWVNRHQDDLIAYLREENRVLREHLGPRSLRRTDAQRRRRAVRGQQLGRRVWMQVAGIVTPDTILRWYRRLIAQTYAGSARRGRGRPMTRRDVAALVVRMAVENPQWGDTRIRGALSHLGHEIARTTVKRILHDHGIDPAPERSRRLPWKTVLQAPWEGLTACDLFTAEVAHAGRAPAVPGLLRDRAAVPPRDHRRDPSAAVRHVDGADGPQCDGPGRWLPAHLRSDHGPEFTAELVRLWLEALKVQTLFIEPGSPWENGYVESFNGKLRDELLDREIFYTLTEAQIVIERWRCEYNTVRPHSALGYRPPVTEAVMPTPATAGPGGAAVALALT